MRIPLVLTIALASFASRGAEAQSAASREQPGPMADGAFLLNTGWKIRPAGEQVPLNNFPMSVAVSNDGKYLLVLNAGYQAPGISVIDISRKQTIGSGPLPDAWLGLTAAPSSNLIYVGGGSSGKVFELSLGPDGSLTRRREFAVAASKAPGAPFVGDVTLSPDARVLYAADLYGDSVAQINLQSGKIVDHWKTGRRPYRIVVSPDGAHLFISSWADGAVYEHESGTGIQIAKLRVGLHPTDMLWVNKPVVTETGEASYVGRLFVAAGNTNSVYSFGVNRDGQLTMTDSINVSMTPMHSLGMTPSGLASDARGTRLYVACSGANAVAVADISAAPSRVLGLAPTGWYPTAVQTLKDDSLVTVNGKGPKTSEKAQAGSIGFMPSPSFEQLSEFTQTVLKNSPFGEETPDDPAAAEQDAYFSATRERPSPIRHVIYIIKGSQTYDEALGDLGKGNGDKSVAGEGAQMAPNLHELARQFVLFDNFYANGDVAADGQNWAVAAIAPDYTVKLWPSEYAARSKVYDFEGGEPANTPPAGYLWNNAVQAGLTVRNYGEWVTNLPRAETTGARQVKTVNDAGLANYTDLNYRGSDASYRDVDRAKEFIREWRDFDTNGQAPQLSILRLSNDGAAGAQPSSAQLLADNDYAVGMIVDAVSHGKLWPSTAVFIVEAAGGNGRDHVDIHRTPAWIISPYTRRVIVDSAMYNQTSALRTIEMISGLRPMTHFDAGARSMFASFTRQPDAKPFDAVAPKDVR